MDRLAMMDMAKNSLHTYDIVSVEESTPDERRDLSIVRTVHIDILLLCPGKPLYRLLSDKTRFRSGEVDTGASV